MYTVRRLDRFKSKYPNLFFGLRPFELRERFFPSWDRGQRISDLLDRADELDWPEQAAIV